MIWQFYSPKWIKRWVSFLVVWAHLQLHLACAFPPALRIEVERDDLTHVLHLKVYPPVSESSTTLSPFSDQVSEGQASEFVLDSQFLSESNPWVSLRKSGAGQWQGQITNIGSFALTQEGNFWILKETDIPSPSHFILNTFGFVHLKGAQFNQVAIKRRPDRLRPSVHF